MTLQDVFDALNASELSQIRLGGESVEGVTEGNAGRIVPAVNLGLTALHRRFTLREERLSLALVPGQTRYRLAPEEGDGGILKIERVVWPPEVPLEYPRREAREQQPGLPLNDAGDPLSVHTPSLTTLEVPGALEEHGVTTLDVVYRANHPRIVHDPGFFYPEEIEVELPETHLEALLLFIASRSLNPLGAGAEGFHEGNNYAQRFEQVCRALESGGYQVQRQEQKTRFEANGFV